MGMLSCGVVATLVQPTCPGPGSHSSALPYPRQHPRVPVSASSCGGPGVVPWRCSESVGALNQGCVAPLVPGLGGTPGVGRAARWVGGPGAEPLSGSALCWRLCSTPQGSMASMKGLLSSCSSSSTAAASPLQQTNSQCWAHRQGGGSPRPSQLAMAEPGTPAGPASPWPSTVVLVLVLEGAGQAARLQESKCSPCSPESTASQCWAGPAPRWP